MAAEACKPTGLPSNAVSRKPERRAWQGMTKAGIERKATCRALFSKLLYLAESEELAPSLDAATRRSLVQVGLELTPHTAGSLLLLSQSYLSPVSSGDAISRPHVAQPQLEL